MKKIKEWISDIDWKYILFCVAAIAGLFVLGMIHYYLFTKPVEDRVNAEWQEKYDDMVIRYEEKIDELRSEYYDEYDSARREAWDSGYQEGYDDGYASGLEDGYDNGYADAESEQ